MTTRRILTCIQIFSLVIVTLTLAVTPVGAAASQTEGVGAGVAVAIPGTVSLIAYLTAGLVVLGLVVVRRRPTV
ncbi:MAG: hypothetical protein M3Q71_22930 [Chloroflexota bacterium]|nr:hypothetical protein [Chloroflexota bacterium]